MLERRQLLYAVAAIVVLVVGYIIDIYRYIYIYIYIRTPGIFRSILVFIFPFFFSLPPNISRK